MHLDKWCRHALAVEVRVGVKWGMGRRREGCWVQMGSGKPRGCGDKEYGALMAMGGCRGFLGAVGSLSEEQEGGREWSGARRKV